MDCTTRLKIGDINKNFICVLCGGYIIDATTIIECLHSFCRTCIVTYLKTSKNCPVCDTLVHKTRPHQNIRSDKLLQDLVYKLVPGLYKDEMRRRREFYTKHYEDAPKRPGEERGDEMGDRFAYTEEEKISLSLHFCPEGPVERVDFRRVFSTKEDLRGRTEKRIQEAVDVRYLQCKAAVTIGHLKKFVRLKYGLPPHFQVDMFYNDEPLRNSCTLCDVAYYFNWTRRAPLMLTFSVFESTTQTSLVKEYPHLTTNNSLNAKSAPSITATTSKPAAALKTEPPKAQTSQLAATTMVPTEACPSLETISVNTTLQDLPAKSRAAANNSQSTAQSSFLPTANSSSSRESMDQNRQFADPSNLHVGPSKLRADPSKLPAGPVKRPPGPSKHPPKARSSCLGKRTASTPIPIAPAPAKMSALNISVMKNMIKADSELSAKSNGSSGHPRIVSFLPSDISQSSVSCIEQLNQSRSSLTFSVSSVPSVMTNGNGIVSVSRNSKPPLTPVFITETALITTSCSTPSTGLSSNQAFSTKPQLPTSFKTYVCAQTQLARHLEASSSALPSCTSSLVSSTLPSSTDSVSIMQSSSSTAVASPTPASSASPTPAAVPSQQSQTQGVNKLHSNTTAVVKQTEIGRKAATEDTSSKPLCQTHQKYMLACKPETSRPCKPETSRPCKPETSRPCKPETSRPCKPETSRPCKPETSRPCKPETSRPCKPETSRPCKPETSRPCKPETSRPCKTDVNSIPTNVHYENPNRTPNCEHRVTSSITKNEVNSVTSSKSNILKTEHKPLEAISSGTVSSNHSTPAKKDIGNPSAISPSSNGAKLPGITCVNPKQNKQKKIADIANTLHKRVNDAFLSMVSKHANSPNNRRPSQSASPGLKSLSIPQMPPDLRETAIMNALSCPSLSVKQSIQNMPPDGHLLTNGTSSNIPDNNRNDEPLNLVKRDREIAKFMNGMFILDIPHSVT